MIKKHNTSLNIKDLASLIRFRQPLEVMDTERNQADNQEVLAFVNAFLEIVDNELTVPKIYRDYTFGKKENFVRSQMVSRLEIVASRIIEKRSMLCSTTSMDEMDFFQEESNFFSDLYYLLVTLLIDLTAIRKQDLTDGSLHFELFDLIIDHLKIIGTFPELQTLNAELYERRNDYPDSPLLQAKIRELLQFAPIREGDFLFTPSKSVSDYSVGEVLVSIDPDSEVDSIEVGDLPNGIDLDLETGELKVARPDDLKAGNYSVLVQTKDNHGGLSRHFLKLPIGNNDVPEYRVAPFKIIEEYLAGDVLAKPNITEENIPIVQANWIETSKSLPKGILLDTENGEITVEDEDMLEVGVFPVSVKLINESGLESEHYFTLAIKQDKKAIYTVHPSKSVSEYRSGDVVATVSDEDGKIVKAYKNALPSGLSIDSIGKIVVSDNTALRAGTYMFNVLAKNAVGVESMKTLYMTLDQDPNPFSYDVSGLKPIDDLKDGNTLAVLTNDRGLNASKVRLSAGELPPGTVLETTGNLSVANKAKLEIGNYDLRLTVFVDGPGSESLKTLKDEIDEIKTAQQANSLNQEAKTQDRKTISANFGEVYNSLQFKILEKVGLIEEISLQLDRAEKSEIKRLQALLSVAQNELAELENARDNEVENTSETLRTLDGDLAILKDEWTQLNERLTEKELLLLDAKSGKWIQYEVSLLLTLEEDGPSAWHMEIPKDWDDYRNNEVLARIVDCDGYQSVNIVEGKLPRGTILNVQTGSVEVNDRSKLVSGEYLLKTKSKDAQNGITKHRLFLIIGGDVRDEDETFVLQPAKPVNNYDEDEIIGYPYNEIYKIISARIVNGILPEGIQLVESSGALVVSDPSTMKNGIFDGIRLKTVNSSGGIHYHNVILNFIRKASFEVLVYDPKPLGKYKTGEKLIQISVIDGSLLGVKVNSGELADGIGLNSSAGVFYVADSKNLEQGNYEIELLLVEENGGEEIRTVNYSIGSGDVQTGEVNWNLEDPLDFSTLENGDIIASPSIDGRTIVNVTSTNILSTLTMRSDGTISVKDIKNLSTASSVKFDVVLTDDLGEEYPEFLEFNIALNPSTVDWNLVEPLDYSELQNGTPIAIPVIDGKVVVSATSTDILPSLSIGVDGNITINDIDALSTHSSVSFNVLLIDDFGFEYSETLNFKVRLVPGNVDWKLVNPLDFNDLRNGDTIASPSIDGRVILNASSKDILPSLSMKSDGIVLIKDIKTLSKVSSVNFNVVLTDDFGIEYQESIDLKVLLTQGTVDWELVNPLDFNDLRNGDTIASPSIDGRVIVNASSKDILPSLSMKSDGIVSIKDVKTLSNVSSVNFNVVLTDDFGVQYQESIDLTVVLRQLATDITLEIQPPVDFHLLFNGDVLSNLNPENSVQSVDVEGNMIDGLILDKANGRVIVEDRTILSRVTADMIFVVKEKGGGSTSKTGKIEILAIPNYSNLDETHAFLVGFPVRLKTFTDDYVNNRAVKDYLGKTLAGIYSYAEKLEEELANPKMAADIISGARSGEMLENYLRGSKLIVSAINKAKTTETLKASIYLYNEFLISFASLSLFREIDISQETTDPTVQMYADIDKNLSSINRKLSSPFIRENFALMSTRINRRFKLLRVRFANLTS